MIMIIVIIVITLIERIAWITAYHLYLDITVNLWSMTSELWAECDPAEAGRNHPLRPIPCSLAALQAL